MTKDEKRTYQKLWIQERRNSWIKSNGPCKICGSWDSLEVDHIHPEEKEMNPKEIWSRREEVRERELAKCQVLCEDCHAAKTAAYRSQQVVHGKFSMYKKGCRCDLCRKANTDKSNAYRWKTGLREKRI